ncbi:hypothetical protein [Dyadobacter bucti]|uniref:hypothetical protein n=1 Tax=Dyadobacter bucti TaxID=2572203 RepID=UPI0011094BD4|nr:hypothetical protein [Dyadobacter bucti]
MKLYEIIIDAKASDFLNQTVKEGVLIDDANKVIANKCGIQNFFTSDAEFIELKDSLNGHGLASNRNHTEYGDYQTNRLLTDKIVEKLVKEGINPEVMLEPTFGEGNFIIAAIKAFTNLDVIYGVEIYKSYVWQAKFSILSLFIEEPELNKPKIYLHHENVFDFNFRLIAEGIKSDKFLILGNPPWVTSSQLGALDSVNLPAKSNFKNHKGLDAITGKGNFDIAEYITLMMMDNFKSQNGNLVFLIKNSVVKNIIQDQKDRVYPISSIRTYSIDTKKEFNASVESCVFFCELNRPADFTCSEYNFYTDESPKNEFGWYKNKFVANISKYAETEDFDGNSSIVWRQGLKHDCSSVMEINCLEGSLINGNSDILDVENDLVFGLLKSSDLKNNIVSKSRKFTIVTQTKVGEKTSYIEEKYPKTFAYLSKNKSFFDKRKSSIYIGKPDYSIFGIGDYSFKPYKVAISGLYKKSDFTLVLPQNEKPLMLDDTCYFLGFDKLEHAVYTYILLNHRKTQAFLNSITFLDAKRAFTKNNLMRLDLCKIAKNIPFQDIEKEVESISKKHSIQATTDTWYDFQYSLQESPLFAFV